MTYIVASDTGYPISVISPLTVSIWFSADVVNTSQTLFFYGSTAGVSAFAIYLNNSTIQVYSPTLHGSVGGIERLRWYNFVYSYNGGGDDPSSHKTFLNGTLTGMQGAQFTATLGGMLLIGSNRRGADFRGKMKHIMSFTTAAGTSEALALFQNGNPHYTGWTASSPIAGMLDWFPLGECAGAVANNWARSNQGQIVGQYAWPAECPNAELLACNFRTAVVSNGFIYTSSDGGLTFTARDSSRPWTGIAISSDGSRQTACATTDKIYVSTDYGVTWAPKAITNNWQDVSMSSDGQYQTAVSSGSFNRIYTSSDFGSNWTLRESARAWLGCAVSSTGQYQAAVVFGGQIYESVDFGVNWSPFDSARNWRAIAMSANGQYQSAVVTNGGQIYVSSDFGATWAPKESGRTWNDIAVSSDGKYQTAVASSAQIYVSSDYGANWSAKDSSRSWQSCDICGTGKNQSAVVSSGQIYNSSDYGSTWTAVESSRVWRAIAIGG